MLKTLFVFAGLAALAMIGVLLLVWWGQERMVFQPPGGSWPDADGAERIDFVGDDGTPLLAYVVRDQAAAASGGPLMIHFHGNAEIAAWVVPWAEAVSQATGATVVVAEYRGYAGLPGSPSYAASRRDALALWEHARTHLGATPERTIVHGFSLGSAVAAELASEIRPRALMLEAPFSSAAAMARRAGPMLRGPIWRLIARVHYDTRVRVAALEVPVWVAHGGSDMIIPTAMGREVFQAAAMKGRYLEVRGAGHNDLRAAGGPPYWHWIREGVASAGVNAGAGER